MVYHSTSPMRDPKSYLEPRQINQIINATPNKKYKRLFFFLAQTGRRVSEVVRCLKPIDIDFTNGLINFEILKRKQPTKSLLPVSKKVLSMIRKHIDEYDIRDNIYLFPMSRQRVDQIFKKSAENVGIHYVGDNKKNKPHVHLLRHSFAIRMAKVMENPADLAQLQSMLGHARIDTTMFYLRFNPKQMRDILEKM